VRKLLLIKFLIISIKHAPQIKENDICKYFTEDVWKKFLHHFLEVLDEYATFTDDFKQVWRMFMDECLKRIVIEIVEHKKLIDIKDLNHLTIGYDIYDVTNSPYQRIWLLPCLLARSPKINWHMIFDWPIRKLID